MFQRMGIIGNMHNNQINLALFQSSFLLDNEDFEYAFLRSIRVELYTYG